MNKEKLMTIGVAFVTATTVSLGLNAIEEPKTKTVIKTIKEQPQKEVALDPLGLNLCYIPPEKEIKNVSIKDNKAVNNTEQKQEEEKAIAKKEKQTPSIVTHLQSHTGLSEEVIKHIVKESKRYDIPVHVAMGVFDTETGTTFETDLISSAGAVGIGQIMPRTGKYIANELGIAYSYDVLFQPKTNISMSLFYLKKQYDAFGTWHKALSAYNQGPGNVRRTGKTSSEYSQIVMNRAPKYKY